VYIGLFSNIESHKEISISEKKRDLLIYMKRDLYTRKETYIHEKRPVNIYEKETFSEYFKAYTESHKEINVYEKRPIDVYEKRPIYTKRDLYILEKRRTQGTSRHTHRHRHTEQQGHSYIRKKTYIDLYIKRLTRGTFSSEVRPFTDAAVNLNFFLEKKLNES